MQHKQNGSAMQTKQNATGFRRKQNGNLAITHCRHWVTAKFRLFHGGVHRSCNDSPSYHFKENHASNQFMTQLLQILLIMPALFLMFPHTYYAQNYADIIHTHILISPTCMYIKHTVEQDWHKASPPLQEILASSLSRSTCTGSIHYMYNQQATPITCVCGYCVLHILR